MAGDARPRQRRPADPRASAAAGTIPSTRPSAIRPTTRSGRFEDSVTIIHSLLREGRADHRRAGSTRSRMPSWSRRARRDLPILIAAKRPRMLDLTAALRRCLEPRLVRAAGRAADATPAPTSRRRARASAAIPRPRDHGRASRSGSPSCATSPPEGSGLSATPLNGDARRDRGGVPGVRGLGRGPLIIVARPDDAGGARDPHRGAATGIRGSGDAGRPAARDRSGRGAPGRTCRPAASPTAGRPPTAIDVRRGTNWLAELRGREARAGRAGSCPRRSTRTGRAGPRRSPG